MPPNGSWQEWLNQASETKNFTSASHRTAGTPVPSLKQKNTEDKLQKSAKLPWLWFFEFWGVLMMIVFWKCLWKLFLTVHSFSLTRGGQLWTVWKSIKVRIKAERFFGWPKDPEMLDPWFRKHLFSRLSWLSLTHYALARLPTAGTSNRCTADYRRPFWEIRFENIFSFFRRQLFCCSDVCWNRCNC